MNIKENCKILKLSYIFKNYEEEIKEAKQTKKDVGIFLDELLEKEINQRKDNGIKKRLRYAKFPMKKYLEDFDRKLYNPEFIKEFDELETLEFIQRKDNGIKKRLRYAKFPMKKYLEDFDRKLYNPEFIKEFDELETLEFIKKKENIILVRNTRCRKNTLCNRFRNQSMHGRQKCFIHISSKFNYRIKRSYE